MNAKPERNYSDTVEKPTDRPRPACGRVRQTDEGKTEWRTERLSGGLSAFYDPCPFCFDEEPEPGERIVRSGGCRSSSYHRPAEDGEASE